MPETLSAKPAGNYPPYQVHTLQFSTDEGLTTRQVAANISRTLLISAMSKQCCERLGMRPEAIEPRTISLDIEGEITVSEKVSLRWAVDQGTEMERIVSFQCFVSSQLDKDLIVGRDVITERDFETWLARPGV
jgi:hypothetical protein